ncbi:MAG: amidase family protein [Paracoccaceae bacterium]|nr:amidase family protein [Paracoccaceae bacterium]
MADWRSMGAAELGREIGAGRIDPRDLAEAFLDAISAHPDGARIYARTMPERARAEAEQARARAKEGARLGPLDGVPLSWKDLFDTAGTATEAGSKLLAGRVPAVDAAVVRCAAERGLVSIGKTHLSELAFSGLGLNPVTATPPNIHDPDALPGGSSSGAAASVAYGLAPLAIGSDTAGSVRIPAAWNDLVGLKTTHGLFPSAGIVPLCPRFDTAGPLARNVEDAARGFEALGGPSPDLAGATLAGVSLLVLEGTVLTDLDPEVASAFDAAVDRLAAAGAGITRSTLPEVEAVFELAALFAPEAYGTWAATIEADPDVMFPPILERFRGGATMPAMEYVAGWQRLGGLRAAYLGATGEYDAVLLPTCPILPPKTAQLLENEADYTRANLLALRNTRVGSLLGLTGLTLPTGAPSVGLLLQGAPNTEGDLLRLGAAASAALA